jgi:hypothetical protein
VTTPATLNGSLGVVDRFAPSDCPRSKRATEPASDSCAELLDRACRHRRPQGLGLPGDRVAPFLKSSRVGHHKLRLLGALR